MWIFSGLEPICMPHVCLLAVNSVQCLITLHVSVTFADGRIWHSGYSDFSSAMGLCCFVSHVQLCSFVGPWCSVQSSCARCMRRSGGQWRRLMGLWAATPLKLDRGIFWRTMFIVVVFFLFIVSWCFCLFFV